LDLKRKLLRLTDAGSPPPKTLEEKYCGKSLGEGVRGRDFSSEKSLPRESPPVDDARLARLARLRGLIRDVIERHAAPVAAPVELDVERSELPGRVVETDDGPIHVADERLEPGHCQGRQPVAAALDVSPATLAHIAMDPTLEVVDPRGMLFLDTETTGLVGGTGTIPFLVGLGWFEDQSLHIEQLFLRQLGQERPLLVRLAHRLARASMLVTYNGKTFDWPLVRTRYVMNRLVVPEAPPHLDLLHCARRVYRRRLGEVRLIHVEERVLGLRREHDIEGSEIPLRYLDYLRTGDASRLVPVIEHNAHDVVSLAAVLGRLAGRYEDPVVADEPEDHLGYARLARRNGDLTRSIRFARLAVQGSGDPGLSVEAGLFLADLYRLASDVEAQERALHEVLAFLDGTDRPASAVHLALAKLYEHRRKDLVRALGHAAHTALAEGQVNQARRLARLERRLGRA